MADATHPVSPALDPAKARYVTRGVNRVQGWLIPSTALYLAGIESAQRGRVAGGICEIGVHRGKSFLTMVIDLPANDPAVAIDVFDMQHLNEDGTSVDARKNFEAFLEEWGVRDRVEVVQSSSLDLEADGFLEAGPRFRLFSIDGGHTAPIVLNDLRLAEATTVIGGVVALDDIFNMHWLGVVTGFFDYIHACGKLRPFALVPNKLLLTDAASVEANRALLRESFGAAVTKTDIPLVGCSIDRYDNIAWIVESTDGTTAPLIPATAGEASIHAELTGLRLEQARLRKQLRQAESEIVAQRKKAETQLTAQRELTALPKSFASPSGRLETVKKHIPSWLQRPARLVYRVIKPIFSLGNSSRV
jgi:hypothetical protein